MAILKCKYCGGNVSAFPEDSMGVCTRCGCTMTLPRETDKQHASTHNYGNYLRRTGKFDQALAVYRKLLQEDDTDGESHWCSALCRFGIQYTPDPDSDDYLPVVTRPDQGAFLTCGEYNAALANSAGAQRLQYEKEAAKIAAVTQEAVPAPEEPDGDSLLKQGFWHLERQEWAAAQQCFCQVLALQPDRAMAHLGLLLAQYHCPNPRALTGCTQEIQENQHYQAALQTGDQQLTDFLQACALKIQHRNQKDQSQAAYRQALAAMESAASREDYLQAARRFSQLRGHRDAGERAKECQRRAEILRREGIYQAALEAKEHGRSDQAAALFAKIPGWRDANVQAVACKQRAAALEAAKPKKEPGTSLWKRALIALLLLAMLGVGGYLTVTGYVIPQYHYREAEALLETGKREEAIAAFQALGEFRDAADRVVGIQTEWYNLAEQLLAAGDSSRAAAAFGGLKDFRDARERSLALWNTIVTPTTLSAGGWFSTALRSDRMANAVGDNREEQCWVGSWMNIRSISAGWAHTLGLRTDGTVIAAGYNGDGRGDTGQWQDMVDISAGQWHTVGLQSNGKVIGLGCDNDGRIDFSGWQDIIAVSAGRNHTVGLRCDGTALATGSNTDGQCSISQWSGLTALSAGGAHTLGLKRDGTVVAAGSNEDGQCNVSDWQNMIAVSAGYYHSVGLKADGTVVAVGYNEEGQCDVSQWSDIVAISAGGWHTLGLKSDGSIVAAGRNASGQCDILGWDNMMLPQ